MTLASLNDLTGTELLEIYIEQSHCTLLPQLCANSKLKTSQNTFTFCVSKTKYSAHHRKVQLDHQLIKSHNKVLLNSFHLNDHTLGFHPQTQKLETSCTA